MVKKHKRRMAVLACSLFLALTAMAQDQPIKIAVVDIKGVIALSDMGKALQKQMQDLQTKMQSEIQTIVDQARDLQKKAQENPNLTDKEKSDIRRALQDSEVEIKRIKDDRSQEAQALQNKTLTEIEKLMKPIFETVRDEGGYDLILDNSVGGVIMTSQRMNISEDILARLNKASAGK